MRMNFSFFLYNEKFFLKIIYEKIFSFGLKIFFVQIFFRHVTAKPQPRSEISEAVD